MFFCYIYHIRTKTLLSMKRILLLLAMSLSLALSSCAPEFDFVEGSLRSGSSEASFSGGNLSVLFPSVSGSVSVDVTATGEWTASFVNDRAKDWCSLSSFEGTKGTVSITVSVKENADYDDRSATINFVCGDVRRSIVVTQKQKEALLVSGNRFDFGQEGGKIALEVKANVQFDYAVSENAKSWIKAVGTKGLTSSTINFEVMANEDPQKREGEIVVTASAGREVVKVYQEGDKPTIVLGKDRYELSSEEQRISVDVRHNVDVTMEIPSGCSWVTEAATKSMSTSTFYLKISENEEFKSRSCSIVFRSEAWNLTEEVVLEQAAATPQLYIGDSEYEFGSDGGELSIDVTSNVDVTVSVPDSCLWIRPVETKGMKTTTFGFVIERNEQYEGRSGVIEFHGPSLGITETVVVRQYQKDAVILSDKYIEIPPEGGQAEVRVSHNIDYGIRILDSWIRQVETKSMTTDVVMFDIEANQEPESREGRVLFTSSSHTDTLVFLQDHERFFVRIKSPESRELSPDGGTLTLVLEHNPYGFRDVQCVFENEGNAVVGDNYVFMFNTRNFVQDNPRQTTATCMYTDNELRRPRYGYVLLYDDKFEHVDTVTFIQPPLTILTSEPEVFIPADALEFSFRVAGTDPGAYRVEVGPFSSWIELVGTERDGDETVYRWKAEANTGYAMRKVDIKIYPVKGGWPDVFRICQEGAGLSFSVTYSSRQVKAPALHGQYWEQSTIWWGDGTKQSYAEGATHSYSESGNHTITVSTNSMEYIDWAEVTSFENGMHIDFSKVKSNR